MISMFDSIIDELIVLSVRLFFVIGFVSRLLIVVLNGCVSMNVV